MFPDNPSIWRLPNEILAEIARLCQIPQEQFLSFEAPFSTPLSSSLLNLSLVCKQWNDLVSSHSPIESIAIRSSAQALRIAEAAKTSNVARRLRCIRLEGGFDQPGALRDIFIAARSGANPCGIEFMYLSLAVTVGHDVDGLRHALEDLDLRRLAWDVGYSYTHFTVAASRATNAVYSVIPKWSRLARIDFGRDFFYPRPSVDHYTFHSPTLREIHLDLLGLSNADVHFPGFFDTLHRMPQLATIYCRDAYNPALLEKHMVATNWPILEKMVFSGGIRTLNFFQNPNNAARVPPIVWGKIFKFATHVRHPGDICFEWSGAYRESVEHNVNITRLNLILTCKVFKRYGVFKGFDNLLELDLRYSFLNFDEFQGSIADRDAFPRLCQLYIEDCHPNVTLLFSKMNLPCLMEVGLEAQSATGSTVAFLEAHGPSLDLLYLSKADATCTWQRPLLDLCENLQELHLSGPQLPSKINLTVPGTVQHNFATLNILKLGTDTHVNATWNGFISSLPFDDLVNFTTIQVPISWPVTQPEIAMKSPWIHRVKALTDMKVQATLVDEDGAAWNRFIEL
ncbi:hypothetical protein EUX98_g4818 [Antrodiella citrinella]|uniref:F-box domain-containing protein n=1 Tax=Antrodiella citrinella TaxID=2447956 RepID=A0A4S4MT62_9APHY|nr:hypothetical protein EUX98_g4818 [Antrodiella citrinella]